uniref:Uncharacterized protein n=1 Tax=Lactuca sativa TaxID=4236 RepID=A0A9R1XWL5_LACSA|nr:hypothetical protein LSAT_V11C200087460 [Lactuca sativa]
MLNISLIVKWSWRLRTWPSSLWDKGIFGIHKVHSISDNYYSLKSMTGTWNNIANINRRLEKKGIFFKQDGESWRCDLIVDGKYHVRALRFLLEHQDQVHTGKFKWIK